MILLFLETEQQNSGSDLVLVLMDIAKDDACRLGLLNSFTPTENCKLEWANGRGLSSELFLNLSC